MIRPSTQVFGLVTADKGDGWLARLYNALFGFNGLDAAYVVFIVQPPHVGAVLDGLLRQQRAHHVHVAPSLWAPVAAALQTSARFVDALDASGPRFEHPARLVSFASPQRPSLLEAAPAGTLAAALERHFLDLGLTVGGAPLAFDTSFEGEPLQPVVTSPPEVWSAASWALEPVRRRAFRPETVLGPPFTLWVRRAGDELTARFGVEPRVPNDLAAALVEDAFRPCQLTDDAFRAAYPHLEARP